MAITRDDIIGAAEALERDGDKATMASVREKLGGGSFATISPVLREWRNERKTTTAIALDMPGELKIVAEKMEAEFWQTASRLANEELVTVQASAEASIKAAEGERDEILREVTRLETALSDATDNQQQAIEQVNTLKADHIRQQEQLAACKTETSQLREDLHTMTTDKNRQADEASRLQGLNDELKREVQDCRQQSEQLRQQLSQETALTATLRAEIDASRNRTKELTQEIEGLRQENKTLHNQTGELQGQLKVLASKNKKEI